MQEHICDDSINTTVYDELPCAFCILQYDAKLTFLYSNKNVRNLFGFCNENDYDDLKSLLSTKDFNMVLEVIQKTIEKGIRQFHFTTGYLLNRQIFQFSYEGAYDEKTNHIMLTITDTTQYRDVEQELNYIRQQHDILMKQTGHVITHYDILTRTLYQPKEAAKIFGLPQTVENAPYSIVNRIVAEESRTDYINFYQNIIKGEPHQEITIRALNGSGNLSWYVMQYDLIYDEDKRPVRAIISYEDITDLQEKEVAYKKWQNYFQSQQEKSIAYYEYNLTKDTFKIMEIGRNDKRLNEESWSFQDLVNYNVKHVIDEESKEDYLKLFSRQRLLKEFYSGEREYRFEHKRLRQDGTSFWAAAVIQLVSDPYTNNILASILIEDIDDEKKSLLQLRHLSRVDPLTGLLNRATMMSEVNELLQNSDIEDNHVLLMIDLDGFKQLNDTMGHQFGDQVLMDVAKELKQAVRTDDLCARLGGDEFIVLLKYTPIDQQLLQRVKILHDHINRTYGETQISTSIGLSTFPGDGWTFDDLYQKADVALYKAKNNGRNQYAIYSSQEEDEQE